MIVFWMQVRASDNWSAETLTLFYPSIIKHLSLILYWLRMFLQISTLSLC